ncbi:hypothetical protein [Eubacterium oxidoreducens]|uniref:Uncharacterized protein n=1 Tax=Eubacterium oxidoreducens TaxID=1732 RepID=A0A1G6CBG8_EUBOX|nr:hypothetical protein [Eubacterium oxidoreducens]SDB30131.1 hypothetical protein SAMN02910417_02254 [Eubacterium oxidoreducens]
MNNPDLNSYLKNLENTIYEEPVAELLTRFTKAQDQMYLVAWAPPLIEYVLWVLKEALEDGIERLYFLARDAYPMYLAAQEITKGLKLPIECRYLRVSRYALRMPEYHLVGEACLERIFLSGINVTLKQILLRANLSEDEMVRVAKQIGSEKNLEQILNRREILELKECVREKCRQGECDLLDLIYDKSKAAYKQAMGYLTQEGLLEDVRWGVVDSGWVGTIQKSLYHLLRTRKDELIVRGYYFGLYELPRDQQGCIYKAYYFMPTGEIGKKSRFSNCLYEVMYSEDSPMVEGYEKRDGGYEPVFSTVNNPNSDIIHTNTAILTEVSKKIIGKKYDCLYNTEKNMIYLNKLLDRGKVADKTYTRLMSRPDEWEAAYYGQLLFSDDVVDSHMYTAANKLTQQEIKDLRVLSKLKIMLGLSDKVLHESAWIEGSIVIAGGKVRRNLRGAKRAKYLTHLRQSMKSRR